MDELEIKIAISYKIPKNDLTLNGILHGLKEDQNMLMQSIVKTILNALEEKTVEEYKSAHPERYYRHGRQPRARKLITSFGQPTESSPENLIICSRTFDAVLA